jgi:putative Holliday junction resolvase
MNILGIDFGKNIGLAIGVDKMAVPLCVVRSVSEIADIIKLRKIDFLVVGWPLLLSGKEGSQCQQVNEMLQKLLAIINIPYAFQDERFSTRFSNKFGGNDSNSAAWILQIYLDSSKHILNY